MRSFPGNDLNLGQIVGTEMSLGISRAQRDKHLYVCGGTGTGKSKFLENLIRQDVLAWSGSKCGLLLLDPHGSLYDNILNWMAMHKIDRPVIPIDLRQDDWIVSYNLLRQRTADPAVLVDNITDAMAYVWGAGNTNQTPLFARWAGNILRALYEKRMTLVESELLIDRVAKQARYAMTSDLKDKPSRQDWMFADMLSPKDFESQIGSTVNRLQRFIRNQTIRAMFGQSKASLDLGRALEEGAIVLVSLATEGAKVSKENAELFATLLLSDLWTAAQERGKRDGVKPFYLYLDEFQRFITPTIAEGLDEARGFGLHITMAHQFPNQLLDRGEHGKRVYNSIMENASSKVVFRLSHEENLKAMAQWLFMGVMNPDAVKHELYSTKVMQYREEMRTSYSTGSGTSSGYGVFRGNTGTESNGGTVFKDEEFDANSWNESKASSNGDSSTSTTSETSSRTSSSVLIPVLGKELSHVQFRSLEEQLFRAMAALFDQQQRQGVARLVGMNAPVSIYTPTVHQARVSDRRRKEFIEHAYSRLPFAIPLATAQKELSDRAKSLSEELLGAVDSVTTARRRLR